MPQPVEELLIQRALQLHDLLAERRLRHMASPRREAEACVFRHREEVSELVKFHRQHL